MREYWNSIDHFLQNRFWIAGLLLTDFIVLTGSDTAIYLRSEDGFVIALVLINFITFWRVAISLCILLLLLVVLSLILG